jgi:hypothetical protein
MAGDVGSDRHLGVGAGGVEALQAFVESLFTHLKSAGAEATLAPLYPSASMAGVAMVPEESIENRRVQAEASLSLSLAKRAFRRMSLPALRMNQEPKAKKDGSDTRVGGGYGEQGSRKEDQTDLKHRGSKRQRGTNALQSARKGQVQEEDETQGWVPY